MDIIFTFIKLHMFVVVLTSTVLQITGTSVLALFSFYGIVISPSSNVFVNNKPVTHVDINHKWLRASQVALILLLLGILLSGIASLAGI